MLWERDAKGHHASDSQMVQEEEKLEKERWRGKCGTIWGFWVRRTIPQLFWISTLSIIGKNNRKTKACPTTSDPFLRLLAWNQKKALAIWGHWLPASSPTPCLTGLPSPGKAHCHLLPPAQPPSCSKWLETVCFCPGLSRILSCVGILIPAKPHRSSRPSWHMASLLGTAADAGTVPASLLSTEAPVSLLHSPWYREQKDAFLSPMAQPHLPYPSPGSCFSLLVTIPGDTSSKEPICQCRRHKIHKFDRSVRNIFWRRKWHPTPVFLPGESHG